MPLRLPSNELDGPLPLSAPTDVERIPILRMGRTLLVTIQVEMHDAHAMQLQEDLSARIVEIGAKGVLIDISALDVVDSFIARAIANISSVAELLDARCVVVGMQPAVAITLVEMGAMMTGVKTALDVERGMRALQESGA
jgi:rsbT antagonist protein RsbS